MRLIRFLIIIFLAISLFNAKVSAQEPELTFMMTEQLMINADYSLLSSSIVYLNQRLLLLRNNTSKRDLENAMFLSEALGMVYLQFGKLESAYKAYDRCWSICQELSPDDKELRHRILYGLAMSSEYKEEIVKLLIKYHEDGTDTYYYHINRAHLLAMMKQYNSAENEIEIALDLLYDAAQKEERWARILYYNSLEMYDNFFIEQGKYDLALLSKTEFQAMLDRYNIVDGYHDITCEIGKSRIYLLIGNVSKAQESLDNANSIISKRVVGETKLQAEVLEIQGDMAFDMGDYASAYQLYDGAIRIMHDLGISTTSLMIDKMVCLYRQGLHEDADELSDIIHSAIKTEGNPSIVCEYYYQYATHLIDEGYASHAIDFLNAGLEYVGIADYDVRLKLKNALGAAHIKSFDYSSAVELYDEILRDEKRRAQDVLAYLPESQRDLYWRQKESLMNNIFKLNQAGTVSAARGSVFEINKGDKNIGSTVLYDASLLNKGLLLEAFLNMQRMISSSGDPELVAAFDELRKLRGTDMQRAETLEATIMSKLRSFGDFMDFTRITWKDVRDNLEEDEAAIEFVVSENDEVSYYSAEILRKGYDRPQHVFLFAQKNEDKSLKGMDVYDNDRLYKKTWAKMLRYLDGCKDIYFAPVGEFYRIGLEYLPVDESSRMNDIYNMHRLSSTKILASGKEDLKGMRASSAALYGGLDYNLDSENMEYYAYAAQTGRRGQPSLSPSDTRSLDGVNWAYLRGTAAEVENISGILQDMKCEADVYTGGEGVEESFKLLDSKSPEIIHVATHGFFFEPSKDVSLSTGLVFAGANNHANGGMADKGIDDGLLTSREIAGLNLSGADLVVLSACQTGTGEISGEGVFGLQRGFKKACAGTLLMSLWEVDDNATSELMTQFYSCLSKGMEKHKALKEAQNHVKQTCGQDPALWAGFILLD